MINEHWGLELAIANEENSKVKSGRGKLVVGVISQPSVRVRSFGLIHTLKEGIYEEVPAGRVPLGNKYADVLGVLQGVFDLRILLERVEGTRYKVKIGHEGGIIQGGRWIAS